MTNVDERVKQKKGKSQNDPAETLTEAFYINLTNKVFISVWCMALLLVVSVIIFEYYFPEKSLLSSRSVIDLFVGFLAGLSWGGVSYNLFNKMFKK